MADRIFSTLPVSLRHRIDDSFDIVTSFKDGGDAESVPSYKRRRIDLSRDPSSSQPIQPGGYILDDTQAGFIVEDSTDNQSDFQANSEGDSPSTRRYSPTSGSNTPSHLSPTHIPLSRIPAALKLLDLQPDDEETLSVFRNAASGWTHPHSHPSQDERELLVNREDWRAICAVLMEQHPSISTNESEHVEERYRDSDSAMYSDADDEPDAESDEYQYEDEPYAEGSASGEEDSDEEYTESRPAISNKSLRNSRVHTSPSPFGHPRKLTPRESYECRRAFARFFPDIETDSDELEKKKITIKEISAVATLLKEKIKAEEVSGLLESHMFISRFHTSIRSLKCSKFSPLQQTSP